MTPKISICIPIIQSRDTARFLARSMKSISEQTFKDYEIVITDEGNFARNHNAAIMKAKGEIVQMLQMDDYFTDQDSLKNIVDSFTPATKWQITSCYHDVDGVVCNPHNGEWTDEIYTGNNKLGSVSTLSMRRENALFFEEPLTWLVDVDLYYRLSLKYGLPKLLDSKNVVIDTRTTRLSHTLPDELKNKEFNYLIRKYGR